jgi:putative pyrimidine permease RutG
MRGADLGRLAPGWRPQVEAFLQSPTGASLAAFIDARIAAGAAVYPPTPLRALELTPFAMAAGYFDLDPTSACPGRRPAMGVQHVIAMFGATVLAPILMGFDPNVAILMSGIGTLIFFVITGGKVPSYLGSSFAFIGVVIAASGYAGAGPNANIGVALGGIVACGLLYTRSAGRAWRWAPAGSSADAAGGHRLGGRGDRPEPGAIPIKNMAPTDLRRLDAGHHLRQRGGWWRCSRAAWCSAADPGGPDRRQPGLRGADQRPGLGKPIDLSRHRQRRLVRPARLRRAGVRAANAMLLIAPVAIILVAENLGHIKAVTAMTGRNLDRYMGRAFMGDGVATMVAGSSGGTGVTTYAENIGVMAATKIYSTAIFVVAALIAILLGFSPKFGALIQAIPLAVMGGVSIVVFGLIAVAGAKIWVDNKVDFSDNRTSWSPPSRWCWAPATSR